MPNRARGYAGLLLIAGVVSCTVRPSAGAEPAGRLYVANSLSRSVSIIDCGSNRVVGSVSLACEPYHVAVSPDGRTAYATCGDGIATLDVARRRVASRGLLALSPMALIHVHPASKLLFVVTAGPTGKRNEERGTAYALDAGSLKTKWRQPVGLNPLCSAMTPDGKRLFVANWGSRDLSVLDLSTGRLVDSLPLDQRSGVRAVVLTSDGRKLYAPQGEAGALWEIDTLRLKRTRRSFSSVAHVYAAALSPDDRYLYLHGFYRGKDLALVRVDLRDLDNTKSLGTYRFAAMLCGPDGKRLYLTGTPGNREAEAVLNRRLQTQMRQAPAQSRAQQRITAQNWKQELAGLRQTVTVLDAATGRQVTRITVGSSPVSNELSLR